MIERSIGLTKDGSKTIFVPLLDENYHSIHGALQESQHVFIDAGLKYFEPKHYDCLNVFEMGYGTGLNAYLTYVYAERNKLSINYLGIEKYPVEDELFSGLDYPSLLKDKIDVQDLLPCDILQEKEWETRHVISNYFSLEKQQIDLHDFQVNEIDLIYYDAFAPSAQPDLWTEEVFRQLYSFLNNGGALVTYCAKGSVKRALKSCGFNVQSLAGPPGKREMVRAIKNV